MPAELLPAAKEVHPFEADAEHSGALSRLLRVIDPRIQPSFRLCLLEFNRPAYRDALIRHINALHPEAGVFTLTAAQPAEWEDLEEALETAAAAHPVLHVVGFEEWRLSHPDVFKSLNYSRERIARRWAAVLLLWLVEPDLKDLALKSPDFWAWRTTVLDFRQAPQIRLEGLDLDRRLNLGSASAESRHDRVGEIQAYLARHPEASRSRAMLLRELGDLLVSLGDWSAAAASLEEAATMFRREDDLRSALHAERQLADLEFQSGELGHAERRLRERVIPCFQQLGDDRSMAISWSQVADVHIARGELDEGLRTLREEALPAFGKLGDVRQRALALGKIADVLFERGELDEALRIRREEELPAFEKLGDVRERAMTLSKIADVLFKRGELEESLRIRRKELPAFERLGDIQSLIVARINIALTLLQRGNKEDVPEALSLLSNAYREANKRGLREAGLLEGILKQLFGGKLPPGLEG